MHKAKDSKPNIFVYDDYRVFLRAYYEFQKSVKPGFSFRFFSKIAGFRSPNFLQLVIEGKRNLSPQSISKFTAALKQNKKEAEYFRCLVLLTQARTTDERTHYADQLVRNRLFHQIRPIAQGQYEYYSNWYNLPIREFVLIPGFHDDPDWIAKEIVPQISPRQAGKSIELLLELGLLQREDTGKLAQADALISTGDQVTSASVAKYHRKMIQLGAEAIDRFSSSERDISSLTISVSNETIEKMKAMIRQFRKELLAMAGEDRNPERLYQINLQVFPLTKALKKDPEK